jgi:hypothetical protein
MNDAPVGRCDFLDVLEESVVVKRPVKVSLRGGDEFTDRVQSVVTEGGEDFVQFAAHGRVAMTQISRAEPTPHAPASYDDKL